MQISEITISKGITLNLGNYQTERIDVTMRATVDPGETWSHALVSLNTAVEASLQTLAAPVLDNMRAAEREAVLRLFETQPTALTVAPDAPPAVVPEDDDDDNAFGYDDDDEDFDEDETESDFDDEDDDDDEGDGEDIDEDAIDDYMIKRRGGMPA